MGNPYLNSDETILLATNNVISRSIRSDVILTNQRLILSDSSHTRFRPQTIPLAVIQTVTKAETATGDPIITLSIATADGATQPMDLVFFQKPREQRKQECDEWIKKLGDHTALARDEAAEKGISITELVAAITVDETPVAAPQGGMPGTQPATTYPKKGSGKACQLSVPRTSSSKAKIIATAAIVIVIIAVLAGAYIHSGSGLGTPITPVVPTIVATPMATSLITTAPTAPPTLAPEPTSTAAPTITQTPTPALTTAPTSTPEVSISQTGVWVRVEYPENAGNYIGAVGTAGRQIPVNATGLWIKRIPAAQTDILDISVQKQSGAGDRLTINIYNNGELVNSGTTTVPFGTVEMHFSLKPALPNSSTTS